MRLGFRVLATIIIWFCFVSPVVLWGLSASAFLKPASLGGGGGHGRLGFSVLGFRVEGFRISPAPEYNCWTPP